MSPRRPVLPASTDWAQTLWKVPPVPKGATAISFGRVIAQNGELPPPTMDYGSDMKRVLTVLLGVCAVACASTSAAKTEPGPWQSQHRGDEFLGR